MFLPPKLGSNLEAFYPVPRELMRPSEHRLTLHDFNPVQESRPLITGSKIPFRLPLLEPLVLLLQLSTPGKALRPWARKATQNVRSGCHLRGSIYRVPPLPSYSDSGGGTTH